MSGANWIDEGKEDRVSFLEDAPRASEGLLGERTASDRLNQSVQVRAATLSGKVKPQTYTQSADSEDHGAAAPEYMAGSNSAATPSHQPSVGQFGRAIPPQGGGTEWQRPRWSKGSLPQSSTSPPSIAAAQRDVGITPRRQQQQAELPQSVVPAAMQAQQTDETLSGVPAQAVAPVSLSATHRSSVSPVNVAHAVFRRAGHSSIVRNNLNRISTVNDISSRWAPDDPVAQGRSEAIRSSVQAATAVSSARRGVAWTWRKSFDLVHGVSSVVNQIRTKGVLATAGGLLKQAGSGIAHLGAALLGKAFFGLLALLLAVLLIIMPLANLIGMGTDMSFGIPGNALDELYNYCTELDAEWTVRVNQALHNGSGHDEVRLNGSPLSGSFELKTNINQLLLYLQVVNSDRVHTTDEIMAQIDSIYSHMYSISTSADSETITESRIVHAGESLGTVVTSAYCNCALCCGQWAGGPTYSGVYPQANHTLAVDANNPTVPVGTQIIMNGTLYKVEDTGAFDRYGVDFDVYMDSHQEALNWGHRSFEAFVAGPEGSEIQVTVSHPVSIYNVELTTNSLYQYINDHLSDDAKEHMELMKEFGVFSGYSIGGNPFGVDNRWIVSDRFGVYADDRRTKTRDYVSVRTSSGREIYSPLDGAIWWSGSTATITKSTLDGDITVKITGLTPRKANGPVTSGVLIGTAQSDSITISVSQNGKALNPAIYLANAPGNGDGQALVDVALTQLGQRGGRPYWSFFGRSTREAWCSEFVSWCANECGFVEAGIIPKYSYSGAGIRWFKEHGQWQPGGYVPNPGDVIFFDWDRDGNSDHTGIVEYSDGATVYTVEGNVGDVCKKQTHSVNSRSIMGYGTPDYS